jgi:hypothetical protein
MPELASFSEASRQNAVHDPPRPSTAYLLTHSYKTITESGRSVGFDRSE